MAQRIWEKASVQGAAVAGSFLVLAAVITAVGSFLIRKHDVSSAGPPGSQPNPQISTAASFAFSDGFRNPTGNDGLPLARTTTSPIRSPLESPYPFQPVERAPWEYTIVYTSQRSGEELYQVRATTENRRVRFFFLGKVWEENTIRLYEVIDGEEVRIVDSIDYEVGSGYSFDSRLNLQIMGSFLYYFRSANDYERQYLIGSLDAPRAIPVLFDFGFEWLSNPSRPEEPCRVRSPNGQWDALVGPLFNDEQWLGHPDCVVFDPSIDITNMDGLVLFETATGAYEIQFLQEYDGDWSIGQIAWAANSEDLFFDNYGAVACIWRYNLRTKELQKIVPDHDARQPFPFFYDGVEHIAYVQDHTIRVARP